MGAKPPQFRAVCGMSRVGVVEKGQRDAGALMYWGTQRMEISLCHLAVLYDGVP
jgi:hypothetical protein